MHAVLIHCIYYYLMQYKRAKLNRTARKILTAQDRTVSFPRVPIAFIGRGGRGQV